jgi:hypothetical protein
MPSHESLKLVAFYWMHPAIASFEPSNPDCRSIEADIILPYIDCFATAQTVTVHHKEEQMIPDPLPSTLRRFQKAFDLGWIKEVLRPMRIGHTLHIIRRGEVEHGYDFLGVWWDCWRQLSTELR